MLEELEDGVKGGSCWGISYDGGFKPDESQLHNSDCCSLLHRGTYYREWLGYIDFVDDVRGGNNDAQERGSVASIVR